MDGRLVIIGGGAAGMSAASAARRVDADLEVVVLEASGYAAYGMCGIPYYLAGLVERAQDWFWSSAAPPREGLPVLAASPVPHAVDWLAYVNQPQTEAEVESLQECIRRRRPYGDDAWVQRTARQMGLEASLRPRGRPPKKAAQQAIFFS